jgi:hypothetical protein
MCFELHSTKSVTTVQCGFQRNVYKNPPYINSSGFLGLNCHFIDMSTVMLLVAILGVSHVSHVLQNNF